MSNKTDERPSRQTLLKNYPFLAALGMTLFLLFSEEYQFNFAQGIFVRALSRADLGLQILGITTVIGSFLIMLAFLWLSLISRPAYKGVYFFIFSGTILTQYNYQSVAGRFMSNADFLTGVTSPLAYWVDAAALFFEWVGLIPIFIYLVLLLLIRQTEQYGGRALLVFTAVILTANSLIYVAGFANSPTISVPALLRTVTVTGIERTTMTIRQRETISYQATGRPTNNVVLIIDESLRGDHMSINGYHRETTPYLTQLADAGLITNWGIAAASSTCSINSNQTIIMGLSTLPDREMRVQTNPTIFHYAKAMGYETHYIDAQVNLLWNGMTASDLTAVDHWLRRRDLGGGYEVDFRAADYIFNVTQRSVGHFIVLNKHGVHFDYNTIYPPDRAVWTPVPPTQQYEDPAEIINTYDNAILYNVDTFFRRLLPDPAHLNETIFLYTSDHGQTLMQEGETWPHCGNTRNEAIVPIMLISKRPYDLDTTYKASHFNIFGTLLDLMSVPDEARIHDYPLSLLKATGDDSTNRFFLGAIVDGSLERADHLLMYLEPVLVDFDIQE